MYYEYNYVYVYYSYVYVYMGTIMYMCIKYMRTIVYYEYNTPNVLCVQLFLFKIINQNVYKLEKDFYSKNGRMSLIFCWLVQNLGTFQIGIIHLKLYNF